MMSFEPAEETDNFSPFFENDETVLPRIARMGRESKRSVGALA